MKWNQHKNFFNTSKIPYLTRFLDRINLHLPGAEHHVMVESFGLLNDPFPFPSILDADYPVFNLHLANILFDVILPSVLGSSLLSLG